MNIVRHTRKGFGIIDTVVGLSILLIVFVGVFGILRLSVLLVFSTKASAGALALANEQLEILRSLPYDDVGTIAGVPAGNIPQNATTTLNLIEYNVRTVIIYEDAPQDGLGVLDANSITADYKKAKVEVSWDLKGQTRSLSLITNIVPRGIETLAGGGTLTVNVFDALGAPVSNADVRIINNTTTPAIDVTLLSNASGVVNLPGAPAASEYEVSVKKTGYSSTQTYDATGALPNPNPGHLSVIVGDTTTSSFSIDLVSTQTVRSWEPVATTTFTDTFTTGANLSTTSNNMIVTGGALELLDPGSGYSTATATALSIEVDPTSLINWSEFSFSYSQPASTTVLFHVYDGSTTPSLVPDVDLPGNSAGFTLSPVDLSGLSTTTHNDLLLAVEFRTDDPAVTPQIFDWTLEYTDGPVPLPNLPFTLRGTKTIGTDGGSSPVYKVNEAMTTDAFGTVSSSTLEWDTYNITVNGGATGYDISQICDAQPFNLNPNVNVTTDIMLVSDTSHTLLVEVYDDNGAPLNGAQVRLHRAAGYDVTQTTAGCGQTFFSSVPEGTVGGGNAYTLDTSATGFTPDSTVDVEVSGISNESVTLFP